MLQEACHQQQTVPMLEYARAGFISLGTREADQELMGKMDSAKQPIAPDAFA